MAVLVSDGAQRSGLTFELAISDEHDPTEPLPPLTRLVQEAIPRVVRWA